MTIQETLINSDSLMIGAVFVSDYIITIRMLLEGDPTDEIVLDYYMKAYKLWGIEEELDYLQSAGHRDSPRCDQLARDASDLINQLDGFLDAFEDLNIAEER